MDQEFLHQLGIDITVPSLELIYQLEQKQQEYCKRIENADDNNLRMELHHTLEKIKILIKQAEQAIDSKSAVSDDEKITQKLSVHEIIDNESYKTAWMSADTSEISEKLNQKQSQKAEEVVASGSNQSSNSHQSSNFGYSFSIGLKMYQAGYYSKAFKIFEAFSEEKNAQAQFMLARMYEKGEGTNEDREKAKFWYKASAEEGNAFAQYEYAILRKEDNAPVKEILSWLEQACDQKHVKSMELYVDMVINGNYNHYSNHILSNSLKYCDNLIEMEDDPNTITDYQSIKEYIKKVMIMDKIYRIGRVFEKLILIMGILYAYFGSKNANTLGFHIILAPGIPVKWKLLHNLLYPFFNPVGIFGLLLIFIGAVVGGILLQHRYYAINVNTIDIFCRAANSVVGAVCIWQFIRIFLDHINWTIQAGNIVIIGGIIFIGRLLGDKIPKVKIQKADLNN